MTFLIDRPDLRPLFERLGHFPESGASPRAERARALGERGAARADHLPAARVARELRPDARLVWHVDEAAGSALDRMNPAASEVRT